MAARDRQLSASNRILMRHTGRWLQPSIPIAWQRGSLRLVAGCDARNLLHEPNIQIMEHLRCQFVVAGILSQHDRHSRGMKKRELTANAVNWINERITAMRDEQAIAENLVQPGQR